MNFQTISGRGYKSQSREKIIKMYFWMENTDLWPKMGICGENEVLKQLIPK